MCGLRVARALKAPSRDTLREMSECYRTARALASRFSVLRSGYFASEMKVKPQLLHVFLPSSLANNDIIMSTGPRIIKGMPIIKIASSPPIVSEKKPLMSNIFLGETEISL